MVTLNELLAMKKDYEHEKIFVEAKISVVDTLIEKEIKKAKENEEVEETEVSAVV